MNRSPFAVAPLPGDLSFDAVVTGLTIDMLEAHEVRRALRDLWIREGVVVFLDVEGEEMHLELSRCFGKLIAHPTREARSEHPELMTVHYEPETGWTLPEHLKQRIEGLNVIYKHDLNPENQKFGRTADVHVLRYTPTVINIQNRLDDYPRVIHPMVYTQQETGRKVLNLSPWFAAGIQGMENEGGDALLEEVAQHMVQSPHVYIHNWKMGEMVLWDNWRVLHNATGAPADEERWMLRTTIEGDYGLGRNEGDVMIDPASYISV